MTRDAMLTDCENLSAAQVAYWLEQHPDFFMGREALLEQLRIPHPTAPGTVSLLERQVATLRHRSEHARQRLEYLQRDRRQLERQYRDMRELVLALLDADGVDALACTLGDLLAERFAIKALALWLPAAMQPAPQPPIHVLNQDRRIRFEAALTTHAGALVALDAELWPQWLPDTRIPAGGGSCALTRLALGEQYGYLLIAHGDRAHLRRGPLFQRIDYLGDVMTRLLQRERS